MNFDLTDEQRDIQRLARDFATGEVAPVAEELDRTKSFPYELVAKAGAKRPGATTHAFHRRRARRTSASGSSRDFSGFDRHEIELVTTSRSRLA